jgi:hypothetical protein
LARLADFDTDGRLAQLGDHLSAELSRYRLGERGRASEVFNLDSLRAHAQGLSQRLEEQLRSDLELEARERRRKLERGEALEEQDFTALGHEVERPFEPDRMRQVTAGRERGGAARARALLNDLAEVGLLGALLEHAHEPDRHVALVEVLKLSSHHERRRFSRAEPGLSEWLAQAYAGWRGALDAAAVAFWDGRARAIAPSELDDALSERPEQVALRLIGPGVTQFLQRESGCHVRRTLASGPEIVRVRVVPGHHEPLAWLERHHQALAAFERGLEGHGPLVENPEQLLPVIRSLRFDPTGDAPASLQLEDYRLLWASSRRVRHIRELLAELWLLGAGVDEARS